MISWEHIAPVRWRPEQWRAAVGMCGYLVITRKKSGDGFEVSVFGATMRSRRSTLEDARNDAVAIARAWLAGGVKELE